MAATLGPNDNCQLWSEWQVPMCGAILIHIGNCQTGLRLAAAIGAVSWLRIQCLNVQLPEWPPLAIASLGPEWPKSAVYGKIYRLPPVYIRKQGYLSGI